MGRKATITDKDQDVINYIISYATNRGYLPTISEIAQGCHISRSNVWYCMHKLEDRGIIIRDGYKWGIKGLKYVFAGGELDGSISIC